MKYIIYCRKSSEEEGKQLQSLETQERILTEFASMHSLEVVDIIKEKKSAKIEYKRAKFTALLERIENGEANAILVIDTDRLTRNLIEGAILLNMFANGSLKEIRTRNLIYASLESLNGLIDKIASATKYSRELQIKVLDGNATKLLKGEYLGYAPIGYVNKFPTIVPDPLYAPYIKQLFDLYKTGDYSVKRLAPVMYEKGFRSRKGHMVTKTTINRILRNPEYYGVIQRKGKLYPSIHQPLIDKATFDYCQDLLSGKSVHKKQKLTFLYRGYLSCAVCGCKLTATLKRGRHVYYYCTNGKGHCPEHRRYLTQACVEALLQGQLATYAIDAELAALSFEAYADGLRNATDYTGNTTSLIDKQIEIINVKLNNLLEALLANRIDNDVYDAKKLELSNEKVQLEAQVKNLKPMNPEFTLEQVYKVKEMAVNCSVLFSDGDEIEKADLLKGLLWNTTIKNQEVASIRFKEPYSYLQNLSKNADFETWRRGRDSNPR